MGILKFGDTDRRSLWDWSLAQEFPRMSKTYGYQPPPRSGLLQADQRTSPAIRDKLGEQLSAMPLPDRLLHLVGQLGQPRSGGKP